jgi:hypothetical protein
MLYSKAAFAHGNACHCVIDRIIVAQQWQPLYEESSSLTYLILRHFRHVKADESKQTFYCRTSVVDAVIAVLVLPCGILFLVVWQTAVFFKAKCCIVLKIKAAVFLDLVWYRTIYVTLLRK